MQKWLSLFIIRHVFLEEEVDKPRSSMDSPLANIYVVKFVVDILLTFFFTETKAFNVIKLFCFLYFTFAGYQSYSDSGRHVLLVHVQR